ncbi:MAG: hypothetical protein IPG10_12275 [Flavobacteriales bacterium]|nr:hypothetical protein [Flavobacteriales bacterium]
MKALLVCFLLLLTTPTNAQLVNGSFESNGAFSLAGWEWTCETPVGGNDVPVGTGQWSVRKNIGDPNCSPNFLYQRIPFAQAGDYWKVSGWVKVDAMGWGCPAAYGPCQCRQRRFHHAVLDREPSVGVELLLDLGYGACHRHRYRRRAPYEWGWFPGSGLVRWDRIGTPAQRHR